MGDDLPKSYRAMVLEAPGSPLRPETRKLVKPTGYQLLLKLSVCAVCRTDLHLVDGELPEPKLPVVPGHEAVGHVVAAGPDAKRFKQAERVGVPWLGWTCGKCDFCRRGEENLCPRAKFTGYTLDGGYAEYMLADARYCCPLPEDYPDRSAAPLLCAGLIGHRAYRKAGEAQRIGLYGFGAAAHIICQLAAAEDREVFAFTRPGDEDAQKFAKSLGAAWAGGSDEVPPEVMDAAIIFAPVGALIPTALSHVRPGGSVVSAGIHMSDIPSFPYRLLWGERRVASVANLTRADGEGFMKLAAETPIRTETVTYPLEQANRALDDLRHGRFSGAAVLTMD